MAFSPAPGIIHLTAPDGACSLSDLIPVVLIQQAFALTDTLTLRNVSSRLSR